MKKLIFFITAILFFISVSSVVAQNSSSMRNYFPPIPVDDQLNFLGQDQYYSVIFRGNGEAVVTAKVIFRNNTDKPLTSMSFKLNKAEPRGTLSFQVMKEPPCLRYPIGVMGGQKGVTGAGEPTDFPAIAPSSMKCLEYGQPDYFTYGGISTYKKAVTDYKKGILTVTLPEAVKPSSTGSFIVYFRAFGFAKRNLIGAYHFVFETMATEDMVRKVQIGIDVDAEQVLEGTGSNVNYQYQSAAALFAKAPQVSNGVSSQQFDQYYQQIGYGRLTKNASNLAPNETYAVIGSFADSKIRLYAKQILIYLGAIFISLMIIFAIGRFISNKLKNKTFPHMSMGFIVVGLSWIDSVLILFYTVLLFYVYPLITSIYASEFTLIPVLLLVVISVGLYSLMFFVPVIYIVRLKGLGYAVALVSLTLFWLLIYLVAALALFFPPQAIPVNSGYLVPMQQFKPD